MKLHRVDMLAAVVAVAVVFGWTQWSEHSRNALPASDWLTVNNISVPDFVQGEDPAVIYDREIKKVFSGTWNVEVHGSTASNNYAVCSGSGTNLYKPEEALPESGVTLSWLIGRICDLPEGQYNLEANWEIRPEGYPPKQYAATSNIFRVLPKGAQLFIEPEQVEQLDKAQKLMENPKIIEQLP